jgi:NTP pyrophosphatase (non-canonical NTP hydrolase)
MKIEKIINRYFTKKYGNELESRIHKLKDEFDELIEAFNIYQTALDPADRDVKYEHLIDEIGDVSTVLSHINSILGVDFNELLINTLVKNRVRETIKEYKH